MIECKTWGTEFEKELNKIQKNGGQLFTYFQQDRATEYLTLYTSTFDLKIMKYFIKTVSLK
jgi:type I restriction enzyme M protein